MKDDDGTGDELELASIVEAFGEARRSELPPSIEEWIELHPRFAEDLAELLPGVVLMESVAGHATDGSQGRAMDEPLPEAIGEYRIIERLGRGGMGVVYLARQESLGREVALKVLPTNLDYDGGFLERFRREARAAAQLSHPHIVPVYGVGYADGRHYFAMRFVDGYSLDAVLREMRLAEDNSGSDASSGSSSERRDGSSSMGGSGSSSGSEVSAVLRAMRIARTAPSTASDALAARSAGVPARFSVRTCVAVTLQVAEALESAHAGGVLHRDIKPGNILLDGDGNAWVTDFGLCRIEDAGSLTSEGAVLGTLRYMAPEQVEGASDERSDVYSLGLVLYELLARRPAFESTRRARLAHDVLHSPPPRLRKLRAEIPRVVETIVQKATSKLPEERYSTAFAFARDLRAYLDNRPIQAKPPSALYLARLFVGRHRLATAVAMVASLLLATLAALYVRDLRASRLESERRAYVGDLVGAEAALRDGAIERAKRRLAAAPERFRAWEWDHLAARVDQSVRTVKLPAPWLTGLAANPTNDLVAVGSEAGVTLVRPADGEVVADFAIETCRSVAWSGDGAEFACVFSDDVVRTFGRDEMGAFVETGTLEMIDRLESPTHVSYSGPLMLIGCSGGEIWVIDRPRAVVRWAGTLNGPISQIGPLEGDEGATGDWWAVTGRGSLAVGRYSIDRRVELDLAGERLMDVAMRRGRVEGVGVTQSGAMLEISLDMPIPRRVHTIGTSLKAVAIDGDLAIAVGLDKLIHFVDLASRRPVRALSGSSHEMQDVLLLPDAGIVVTTGTDGALRFWPRIVAGGGVRLEGHVHDVNGIAFSPDGGRIATSGRDGQVIIWDAVRCEPICRLVEAEGPVGSVAFLDGGRRVVGGVSTGTALVWNLERGKGGALGGTLVAAEDFPGSSIPDLVAHDATGTVYLATADGIVRRDADLRPVGDPWHAGESIMGLALDSRGGTLVGVTSEGGAFGIDVATGRTLYSVEHGDPAMGLGMSLAPPVGPAAGLAAYATLRHEVVVFRVSDGAVVTVISNRGPAGALGERLMGATFSPDGQRVLATTRNGLLSVYSVGNWEHLIDLRGHVEWAMRVDRCDATGAIVSVSSDETARVWNTLSSRAWLEELGTDRGADAARRVREELRRPNILESIWEELAASPAELSPSSWRLITLMNSRDPGDPLTSGLHALASARRQLRAGVPAQLEFASRKLPADDPRQPELRRTIREYQRSRLVADVTGFAPGVEPSDLLPRPSVQRTLLAAISYFPWLPVGRAASVVAPWVTTGLRIRSAILGR